MIQNLNIILITASELVELRKKLKHLETKVILNHYIYIYIYLFIYNLYKS